MKITRRKRDKRSCLEKEIDSALMKMSDYDVQEDSLMNAIERALAKMETFEPGSEEYNKTLDCVETLCKSKKDIKTSYPELAEAVETLCKAKSSNQTRRINANTIVSAVVSILGIVLVLQYEKLGVITSKGFALINKGRV